MFSPEKSVRQSSIEKLKFICGAQIFVGVGILVCAMIAVVKQDNYFNNYFIGGFTCGIAGALSGACGIYTIYKASSLSNDDVGQLRKELQCSACLHMILGYILFFMSVSGILMNILFLATNDNDDDDDEKDEFKIHVILSACILAGIVLLLVVTFLSFMTMGTCCQHQGFNQRINHANYPTTVGGNQYNQGPSPYAQQQVYTTGGFNQASNPPPYAPPSQSYGFGQNSTQYGVQPTSAPSAPPPPYSY